VEGPRSFTFPLPGSFPGGHRPVAGAGGRRPGGGDPPRCPAGGNRSGAGDPPSPPPDKALGRPLRGRHSAEVGDRVLALGVRRPDGSLDCGKTVGEPGQPDGID